MDHLISATRSAIASENWYAALAVALAIPDICARIETPREPSSKRFQRWWDEHLTELYSTGTGERKHVFLHAEDAYALRCAFLHEGRSDIEEQRARKALSNFRFVAAPAGTIIHCNLSNDVLQLQVDIFCEDICRAASEWVGRLTKEQVYPPMLEIEKIDFSAGIRF